jgi:hypothetical protein
MADKPRRGRPPVEPGERSVLVTVTLPAGSYDRYCLEALRESVSVPEIIRRQLKLTKQPKNRHER